MNGIIFHEYKIDNVKIWKHGDLVLIILADDEGNEKSLNFSKNQYGLLKKAIMEEQD